MNFIENLLAKSIKFELGENETIIHQGGANLFRSNDVSGGILYLTNERLIFIPHKININKSRHDIEIDDIVSIKEVKTLIIDNGLVIESKDDSKFRFVLNSRDKWVEEIEKLIN
jgi:GRAM domain